MATNSGYGPPFNGRQFVKDFRHNDNDVLHDAAASNLQQQPTRPTKTRRFLDFFKISSKPSKQEKADTPSKPEQPGFWHYPSHLDAPSPMQILHIMQASPEHQLKLNMDKAKKDAELKQQGRSPNPGLSKASQSTDTAIVPPTTDSKWSFDGKSVLHYRRPDQSSPRYREPVNTAPQPMWHGQAAIPHPTYQKMMPRVGNEVSASTRGPAVWSNVEEVEESGASFFGGNPSRQVPEPRSERYIPEFERFNPRSEMYDRRHERYEPPSYPINMSNLRTPYEIADAAHVQSIPGSRAEWCVYLEGYREVRDMQNSMCRTIN